MIIPLQCVNFSAALGGKYQPIHFNEGLFDCNSGWSRYLMRIYWNKIFKNFSFRRGRGLMTLKYFAWHTWVIINLFNKIFSCIFYKNCHHLPLSKPERKRKIELLEYDFLLRNLNKWTMGTNRARTDPNITYTY